MPDRRPDTEAAGGPTVEDRRRVIELALARRPELDLDELATTLERLGLDVDAETLIDDLDALGYDVDDPADVDGEDLDGEHADDDEAPDADADADADTDTDTDADGDLTDTDAAEADLSDAELADVVRTDQARPIPRHAPLMVAAAAVLVIIVAAAIILGGGDDDDEDTPAAGSGETVQASSGPGAGSGPTEPQVVAPAGPGPDPALTEPDLTFDFEVDSAVLPAPTDGTAWEVFGGDFQIVGGRAVTSVPGEEGVLVAVNGPTPDARIQVTLADLSEASGLAFRIGDGAADYYAWVVAPVYSTVNLYRVSPAGRELVANSGVTALAPGMTLGVNLSGTTAELLANGVVVAEAQDVGTSARWGLTALSATTPGAFDDLLVQYA